MQLILLYTGPGPHSYITNLSSLHTAYHLNQFFFFKLNLQNKISFLITYTHKTGDNKSS